MRSKLFVGTVAVLALAGLAGCNERVSSNDHRATQNPQTASSETQTLPPADTATVAKDSTPNEASSQPLEVTATTKRYAEGAASADMFEVESSKIALDRSKSPEIKKFAQEMVSAHTGTSDELKT